MDSTAQFGGCHLSASLPGAQQQENCDEEGE
jgi:hypothetical protein